MLGLLYADDVVLCGESGENLKVMVGLVVEVCRRRGLKVNTDKIKVMALGEGGGRDWSVRIFWVYFESIRYR